MKVFPVDDLNLIIPVQRCADGFSWTFRHHSFYISGSIQASPGASLRAMGHVAAHRPAYFNKERSNVQIIK